VGFCVNKKNASSLLSTAKTSTVPLSLSGEDIDGGAAPPSLLPMQNQVSIFARPIFAHCTIFYLATHRPTLKGAGEKRRAGYLAGCWLRPNSLAPRPRQRARTHRARATQHSRCAGVHSHMPLARRAAPRSRS